MEKIRDAFEHIISKGSWLIKETSWERNDQEVRESQFTLGNGYLCSRGVLEEIPYDAHPGTYMAGLYDEAGSQVTEIVNLPNPINFKLIAQGEKVGVIAMDTISHNRVLDMQKGILKRRTVYATTNKERFDYQSLRFFSMANPHIGAMQIHFTPLDADADIIVETFTDTSMTNKGILSEGRKRHFEVNKFINVKNIDYVCVRTFQRKIGVGYANHLTVTNEGKSYGTSEKILRLYIKKGETATFTKIFTIHSTRDLGFRGRLERRGVASCAKAVKKGFERLLEEHIEAWRRKWDISDIDIRPDVNLQAALRFNIYHMIICSPPDSRSSVPARTLSGEGYRGHIFWDTEIFMLPFYIFTNPETAKRLLLYRYKTLPAARRNARERGYKGALFSWESADTGKEVTPEWHRDLDGKVIRIYTGKMENHIVADIAYAVNNYFIVTADEEFMLEAGLEIIFECARFWASRVEYNKNRDVYSIKNIIGPDEFHINVSDNAFTNVMARWNLVRAVQLCRNYQARDMRRFKKLVKRIKLRESEIENWARVSNRIPIRVDRNGIIECFNGFFKRKYMPIRELDHNFMPTLPKKISPRQLKTTQFVKQADTVMIFHLLPDSYPLSQRRKNFDYYDKRTLHKSSLSPSMCALTGWDAGSFDKAYHYFLFSLYGDIENKHGSTDGGIHAASLGGNWQMVFHAFAGIRIKGGVLTINPSLPREVNAIYLNIKFRKWVLGITVSKNKVKILPSSKDEPALRINIFGKSRGLRNGKVSVFESK
ncbi:MAG: glycoside hydrolase family 65 protein [Candidatus Omnitrophica bacterium]|nr:glycoside hydrolase family 65 protein [Candidatus Omnitrophota bacterium]